MIIPALFMKALSRSGLGRHLVQELRYAADGAERGDFILNRGPCRHARILIADRNFGCGSSREHAVWALADFGIRCIVAPSFGDIFSNNARKNGLLLIRLPEAARSEEHTSELQSLMRISSAVFCLKKKKIKQTP